MTDAVARVCAQVREREILLRQRVLDRAQEVGFPMLGHGEGRGAVAFSHEGLHLLEGRVRRADVLLERAAEPGLRLAEARRWESEGGEADLAAFSTERPRVMPSALEWAVTEWVLMKSTAHWRMARLAWQRRRTGWPRSGRRTSRSRTT